MRWLVRNLARLPLYRQQQIYKRWGVSLPRSTLGDWVAGATQLLEPVARRIGERALGAAILQTDDTRVGGRETLNTRR